MRPACLIWSQELSDHLNGPADVLVELGQIFGGDPILLVTAMADRLYLIMAEKIGPHLEAGHVPGIARCRVARVPVSGDLGGICLAQYGIEDRLFGEARREGAEATPPDQIKFAFADRAIEDDSL